jgi:hypothetical protein
MVNTKAGGRRSKGWLYFDVCFLVYWSLREGVKLAIANLLKTG